MDTTYVISVDSLDLSLLPSTYQYGHNMSPLWNRHNDLREFSVSIGNTSPSQQSVTEESTQRVQAIERIETTMCHICKVLVPKPFLKQHKDSSKHKTYTKIANIALQRITEHINHKCDCDETEVDTSNYFCSHCIAVVKISEKKSHENSDSHKNTVYVDKCLSNFLDLYSSFGETDNDDMDSDTSKASSSSQKNYDNKFDLNNYFEILKNKYNMSIKFKILDEEKLEFDIDGKKLELAVQNFHGLKTGSSDSLECVVCKEVVKDKIEHIMQVKHMHRVSISFKDIHCNREIYPSWHHCVLCNVITDDPNKHTISDLCHKRLLQEAIKHKSAENSTENSISPESWTYVTNKTIKTEATSNKESSLNKYSDLLDTDNNSMGSKDDIVSTVNKTFCSYCNVYIVTKNLRKHLSTKKHLSNMISKYYYLFKIDLDITSCRVCDVVVHVDDFEKHVVLSEHKNKYDALLATNKVRKIDNNQLFCGICDKLVLVKNELYHIKDKGHMEYLASHGQSSPTTSAYHCSICDVRVPNTVEDIQSHNKDISHNSKKLTNAIDTVCTVKSTSYFDNYTMLETQSPDLVNCMVCDILILKDKEFIQNHIVSENHLKKYEKLLKDHQLAVNNDNIYCDICKVFVGLKSEIMHVRGKRHLKNVRKAKEKPVIPLSVEDNAKLEAVIKVKASGLTFNDAELNVIIEDYDISDNLKELVCKTCKVTVPFTIYNSRGHLEGSKHKQKLLGMDIINSESTSAS